MTESLNVLLAYTAWTLLLVLTYVLYRTGLVFTGKTPANSWTRGAGTWKDPEIITRISHAHMNCVENLPVVAVVILIGQVTNQSAVTDPLACWLLAARIAQSTVHVIAVNHWMVFIRASFWTVQALIVAYWILKLAHLL
jgi:hypothetical protein